MKALARGIIHGIGFGIGFAIVGGGAVCIMAYREAETSVKMYNAIHNAGKRVGDNHYAGGENDKP
jgi:hypothetical protein